METEHRETRETQGHNWGYRNGSQKENKLGYEQTTNRGYDT